ncbi:hypothetical protein SAMN02745135_01145 [Caloranaerobacter azorensis DSM 13643]|uniref:Uncharacterized protein n=2 Tax=Caloranaerobacter azorensis TaxID=116090 RepID=A0A1M5TUQ5_9FIRM|nr:hypothetical protein SAMN02745135_01145 [Caloranaerobacter azorensis DSM 13643]
MLVRIVNTKYNDSVIIEAETIEEIRRIAREEVEKRGWDIQDMYSEEVVS